jgi:hypothetical protein
MSRPLGWVAVLLLAVSACTTVRPAPWGRTETRDPGESRAAVRAITHADDLVRRGQARAALAAYERVLREHPGDPAGAAALYGVGRLHADPAGGVRDSRAALRAFSRLLADYPESRWAPDARAWQAVLTDLIAREADTARLKDEAAGLKTRIEQLRRTDLELERRR